mgnify:CR=1 FL=1
MIVDHQVDGLIVPQTSGDFAAAIVDLLTDEDRRKRMAEGARKKVLEKYNMENDIGILVDAYNKFLGDTYTFSPARRIANDQPGC